MAVAVMVKAVVAVVVVGPAGAIWRLLEFGQKKDKHTQTH